MGHQRRNEGIWPVAELFGDGLHAPTCVRRNAGVVAQSKRHGRAADARLVGDILKTDRFRRAQRAVYNPRDAYSQGVVVPEKIGLASFHPQTIG
jgi:hypothetical protein